MPRPFSGPQRALMASKEYDFHTRALVQRDDGVWQDFANLGGYDWLESGRWTDSRDQPTMEGSVIFAREHYDGGPTLKSLAPYMVSSTLNANDSFLYSPAIKGGRGVALYISYTAKGVAPTLADWIEVFTGYIHNPEWGGSDSIVTCAVRDIFGYLMSQWTEGTQTYSTSLGMPFEDVLQAILNANPNVKLGPVALYTPVSPGTNLRTVTVEPKPVLLALRDLAAQIGWDVKGMYDAAGRFRLTFFEPDRSKVVPDYTLGPDEYISLDSFDWGTDDIRNKVEVVGYDGVTGARLTSVAEDLASQQEFGVHYSKMVEEAASNLDTQAELDALSSVILADLSRPFATMRLHAPFLWHVQTTDMIGVAPNFVHHDEQLNLAVMQTDFSFERGDGDVIVALREQVAGFYKEWLKKEDPGGIQPSQAPTISGRLTMDIDWLAYVYATPVSPTGEKVTINLNDDGYWGFPVGTILYLCASNVDPTRVWLDSGTELDPADSWFTDGTTIILAFDTISLVPGKTLNYYIQAEAQRSGLVSGWVTIPMSYAAPMIASASLGLLPSGPFRLQLMVTAGQNMQSVYVEIRDSATPGGGVLLTAGIVLDVATGNTVTQNFALSPLNLLKTWYAHLTPRVLDSSVGWITAIGTLVVVMEGAAYNAPTFADIDSEALVATLPASIPSARLVTNTATIVKDFSVPSVAKFNIANSALLPGAPTVATPPSSDDSLKIANTEWVNDLVGGIAGAIAATALSSAVVFIQTSSEDHSLTTIPAIAEEIESSTGRLRRRRDLTGVGSYRLNANITSKTGTPTLIVEYSTDDFATTAVLGTLSISGTGRLTTGRLAAPAGLGDVQLRALCGDGAGVGALALSLFEMEYWPTTTTVTRDFSDDFSTDFS